MKLNFLLLADLWGVARQTSHQQLHSFCSRLVPNKGQLSGERLRRGHQQGDGRLRGDEDPKDWHQREAVPRPADLRVKAPMAPGPAVLVQDGHLASAMASEEKLSLCQPLCCQSFAREGGEQKTLILMKSDLSFFPFPVSGAHGRPEEYLLFPRSQRFITPVFF